ncbi:glycogen synthase GlgA [Immundisolibacter sp.]|uniref:glycogen synthase GlgA n=1 Tax=Immundisolibacter sp. TaxID=1934948 RepID=UPI002B06F1C6|nr:glycogen synthase GlgA [Immundisolibacter sp.]MEA3220944.1 Glycogen synthase [Immundisolibacter sp.]
MSRRPRVLLAASEAYPLIKTGGLGDVVGALPAALRAVGVDARLVLPAYPAALAAVPTARAIARSALYGTPLTLLQAELPIDGGRPLPVYLIQATAFERSGNPYQDVTGQDWPDNPARFALFCRGAAALALGHLAPDWRADVVHAHDWQAGLLPALLSLEPKRPRTVFTVHNLAYQGLVAGADADTLGLPADWWSPDALEFYGQLALIKGGLAFADRITTVSPRYAQEIQTAEFGCGLDGLLRYRSAVLVGILNGIDTELWNPATDPALAARYDAHSLERKAIDKAALQTELGLAAEPDALLLGMVSRLVEQKGVDLLLAVLGSLPAGVQVAVLGSGQAEYEAALTAAASQHPGQIAFKAGYDEGLAHRIQAGADAYVMPSRFEPCGLTQLYALRYGTVPIVRAVGGLADTVVDATAANLAAGRATGIVFEPASSAALAQAIQRALDLYRAGAPWRQMQLTGMAQDHSWQRAAERYLTLYQQLLAA